MNKMIPEIAQLESNTGTLVKLMGGEKGNIFVNQVMIQEIFNIMTLKAQRTVAKKANKIIQEKLLEWSVEDGKD